MDSYGQFCPVAKAAEIFASRWTPLILREILYGSHRFSDMQKGLPLISRALLSQRLRELETAGILVKLGGTRPTYHLTQAGLEFKPIVEALGIWGNRWGRDMITPADVDARLLMWSMKRSLDLAALPDRRVVVRFNFRAVPGHQRVYSTWWLVLEPGDSDLCMKDPGYPVDLVITAKLADFMRAWMGYVPYEPLVRGGSIRLEGPRELVRGFPDWLQIGRVFPDVRPDQPPPELVRAPALPAASAA